MKCNGYSAVSGWQNFAFYLALDNMFSPCKIIVCDAGIAQLVERNLAKVEVASSRLVSRSRIPRGEPIGNTRLSLFV